MFRIAKALAFWVVIGATSAFWVVVASVENTSEAAEANAPEAAGTNMLGKQAESKSEIPSLRYYKECIDNNKSWRTCIKKYPPSKQTSSTSSEGENSSRPLRKGGGVWVPSAAELLLERLRTDKQ